MYERYCLYPQGYSPAPSMFKRGCLLAVKRQGRGFRHTWPNAINSTDIKTLCRPHYYPIFFKRLLWIKFLDLPPDLLMGFSAKKDSNVLFWQFCYTLKRKFTEDDNEAATSVWKGWRSGISAKVFWFWFRFSSARSLDGVVFQHLVFEIHYTLATTLIPPVIFNKIFNKTASKWSLWGLDKS